MLEQGLVISTTSSYAKVRLNRNSACGSCGKCGMTDNQKYVDFLVQNSCNATVGQVVEIDIPETNSAKLAFVGYIVPLLPALILLFVALACSWAEWLAVVLFFVGLIFGFVIVALMDKYRKKSWTDAPTMTNIVVQNTIETNNCGGNNE